MVESRYVPIMFTLPNSRVKCNRVMHFGAELSRMHANANSIPEGRAGERQQTGRRDRPRVFLPVPFKHCAEVHQLSRGRRIG